MTKYSALFFGFLHRQYTLTVRYPVNLLGMVLNFLLLFLTVFLGGHAIAPVAFGDHIGALIVGFFLWTTSQTTFMFLSQLINNEAQWGTLERLFVTPFRFSTVLSAAVLANVALSVFIGAVNLVLVIAITREPIVIDILTVIPILLLTLCTVVGLGFAFGGIALIYKRIQGLLSVAQFMFIGLISLAMTDLFLPRLLPVGQGTAMLTAAMTRGTRLWEFPLVDHVLLLGTAIGHLAIGYTVFYVAQRRVRRHGLLDDY